MKKKYKYQLPQNKEVKSFNTKIENGNLLVEVELGEKIESKDGDFLCAGNGDVFIYSSKIASSSDCVCAYCGAYGDKGNIEIKFSNNWVYKKECRYATEKEKADFLERLEKELHKRWNAETKQLEDIRWKPKEGGNYWFIDIDGEVAETIFTECSFSDKACVAANNCFRTEEAAQPYAEQIKEILKNSKAE